MEELRDRVGIELGRIVIDDMAEDQRIEQGKSLVDRGEHDDQDTELPIFPEIGYEDFHQDLKETTS